MSECQEIALALLPSFQHWYATCFMPARFAAIREFVRMKMPDESQIVRDHVIVELAVLVNA